MAQDYKARIAAAAKTLGTNSEVKAQSQEVQEEIQWMVESIMGADEADFMSEAGVIDFLYQQEDCQEQVTCKAAVITRQILGY